MLPSHLAQCHGAAACIQRGWRASSSRAEAERRRLAYVIVHASTDFFWPLAWLKAERHELKQQCEVTFGQGFHVTGDWSKPLMDAWSQLVKRQGAAASIQRRWRVWSARAEVERRRLAFLIVHSNADVCWPLAWLRSGKNGCIGEESAKEAVAPSYVQQHHAAAACIQRGWRLWSARAEVERRRLAFLIVTSSAGVSWPLAWQRSDGKLLQCPAAREGGAVTVPQFARAPGSCQGAAVKRVPQEPVSAPRAKPLAPHRGGSTVEEYEVDYLLHRQEWGRKEIERQAASSRQDLDMHFQEDLEDLLQKAASRKGEIQKRSMRPQPMSSVCERQGCTLLGPSPKVPLPQRSPASPFRLSAAQRASPKPVTPASLCTANPGWPHSELLLSAESGSRPLWAPTSTHVYKKASSKASHLPPLERAMLSTPTNSRPTNTILQRTRTSLSSEEFLDELLMDLPSPTAQSGAAAAPPPAAVVDRSGEGLRDSQVQPLLQSLCGVRSIQKLNLSHNKLTDASLRELLPVLSHPGCALRILELAGNQFTKASLRPFFDIIGTVNQTLEVLDLSGCMRDPSSHRFLVALQGNCRLQTLVLDGNQIGEEGVAALAMMLKNPGCSLATLSLAQNAINNRAVRHLLNAIRGNALLTHLSCCGNPCSEVYLQEMGFLMDMNSGHSKPGRAWSPSHGMNPHHEYIDPAPRSPTARKRSSLGRTLGMAGGHLAFAGVSPRREQTEPTPSSPTHRKRSSVGRSLGMAGGHLALAGISPRREYTEPLSPTTRKRLSIVRSPGHAGGQQTFAGNFVRNRHNLSPTPCY